MRIVLAIVLALAASWAGYWVIGSRTVESGVASWFDARRADGWVADYDDLSVNGFPNRFDTSLTGLELSDPATGFGWQAPFFQILTLSYTPNHLIAIWPREQHIDTRRGSYTLSSSDMRASLVLRPSGALALRRATLTSDELALVPDGAAAPISAAALRLAAEEAETAEAGTYHLGLAADEVAPPKSLLAALGSEDLPRVLESIAVDTTVRFDRVWDRAALRGAPPQPQRIDVKRAAMTWGEMRLSLEGSLDVDDAGRPEGTLTLRAHGWRKMLALARGAGLLNADMASGAERTFEMLAKTTGGANTLEVPLKFEGGRIWLGPLPIADAPLMRLGRQRQ